MLLYVGASGDAVVGYVETCFPVFNQKLDSINNVIIRNPDFSISRRLLMLHLPAHPGSGTEQLLFMVTHGARWGWLSCECLVGH